MSKMTIGGRRVGVMRVHGGDDGLAGLVGKRAAEGGQGEAQGQEADEKETHRGC